MPCPQFPVLLMVMGSGLGRVEAVETGVSEQCVYPVISSSYLHTKVVYALLFLLGNCPLTIHTLQVSLPSLCSLQSRIGSSSLKCHVGLFMILLLNCPSTLISWLCPCPHILRYSQTELSASNCLEKLLQNPDSVYALFF